jgi:Rps23 Pro-64 3,4-dihydroxylase Tpa1-like proline 4-hydroxylase
MNTDEKFFYFDKDALLALAHTHKDTYHTNVPFQHVVIDNFLPPQILEHVLAEFPHPDSEIWQQRFNNPDTQLLKLACEDETRMPDFTRHVLAQFNSAAMSEFVEILSGIKGIIPDPHYRGGGLHQTLRGGNLGIHLDFNRYKRLSLNRRVNILLYLNKDWKEEYGGYLELWDKDMAHCVSKVAPLFNRMVMFSTTGNSYHGHPDPLTCPLAMTRKSLALYYYTTEVGDGETETPHTTLFQKRPGEKSARPTKEIVKDFIPPIALRALQHVKNKIS